MQQGFKMRLTDEQSKQIAAASNLLAPYERERFLRSVNNRLNATASDQISDDTLYAVVSFVLSGFGVSAGRSLFTKTEDQTNDHPTTT
jgi:hypothetical protein